jgi:hypothetical protein
MLQSLKVCADIYIYTYLYIYINIYILRRYVRTSSNAYHSASTVKMLQCTQAVTNNGATLVTAWVHWSIFTVEAE